MIKVMHIDADAQVRATVDMVLCLTGEFVVLPCATGEEALEQLSAFGPEIVLIDLMQTGENGARTLAAIHASPEFANTPVIFVTDSDGPADIDQLRISGAVDVIGKPFDPVGLADRIRNALPDYA